MNAGQPAGPGRPIQAIGEIAERGARDYGHQPERGDRDASSGMYFVEQNYEASYDCEGDRK